MMKTIEDLDKGTIRRIDWQELFPGVLLFRALTLAFRLGPIFAGAFFVIFCAVLATPGSHIKLSSSPQFDQGILRSLSEMEDVSNQTAIGPVLKRVFHGVFASPFEELWTGVQTEPFRFLPSLVFLFLIGIFFGLAFSRKAAVRLASTERSPLGETLKFAFRRYLSVILAGLIPGLGLACCALVLFLLSRNETLFCVTGPISFLVSLVAVLTGWGIFLGAPIMIAAVAVDRCDGFDAFSRTFSYLHQRPFHFLFYSALALVFGWIGNEIVQFLTLFIIRVLGFFASDYNLLDLQDKPFFFFWLALTVAAPIGFRVAYYFIASTAIYFILRRSVDGIAFDQFAKTKEETPHRLRPILSDAEGAPVMADDGTAVADSQTEKRTADSEETTSETPIPELKETTSDNSIDLSDGKTS